MQLWFESPLHSQTVFVLTLLVGFALSVSCLHHQSVIPPQAECQFGQNSALWDPPQCTAVIYRALSKKTSSHFINNLFVKILLSINLGLTCTVVRKVSFEHMNAFLYKYIFNMYTDVTFTPDVGNNPGNPPMQKKQQQQQKTSQKNKLVH